MNKEIIKGYFIYGENCIYTDYHEIELDGVRYYINYEFHKLDEDGNIDEVIVEEGFMHEIFIGDDGEAMCESEYNEDCFTEFTNGLWREGQYDTYEEAMERMKELMIVDTQQSDLANEDVEEELRKRAQQEYLAKLFEPESNRSENYDDELIEAHKKLNDLIKSST